MIDYVYEGPHCVYYQRSINIIHLHILLLEGGGLGTTNGLQRHIPRVSRAIVKVVNNVEHLDHVAAYLEMLGKIHQQIGVEVI